MAHAGLKGPRSHTCPTRTLSAWVWGPTLRIKPPPVKGCGAGAPTRDAHLHECGSHGLNEGRTLPIGLADRCVRRPLLGTAGLAGGNLNGHGWALAHLERSKSAYTVDGAEERQRPARANIAPLMRESTT